jgi:hypothetical protein
MHIVEGDSSTGFRVGGLPPVGVKPSYTNELTQYFGTFPIAGHQEEEISIFTSFEYLDPDDPFFFTRHINKPLGAESEVLQCVFHKPEKRAKKSSFASELQGYAVKVDKESIDNPEDAASGVPHKIGGVPFLRHYHPDARKASSDLLNSGYIHFLQWSGPVGKWDCKVKGKWAFPNYRFNLYLKQTKDSYEYRALLV